MSSLRIEKVNSLIQKELSNVLMTEGELGSGILVTISKIRTTSNLREAKVFISIFPEDKAFHSFQSLSRNLYKIQGALNQRLTMRPIPRIALALDASERKAQSIEDNLAAIRQENTSSEAI